MDAQTIAAILFVIALAIFLFIERKKLVNQGIFPLFYVSMYKTKLGLNAMDRLAEKWPRAIKVLAYIGVTLGFVGMVLIAFLLIKNFIMLFISPPAIPGVAPVLPVKAKGVFYVPFFYWIISIFIIAVIHEFSHGVVARAFKMKVKSSGFAFLGIIVPIIPMAFVEPDEEKLQKEKPMKQLSVFAAGPFSNIALAFIIVALFALVLSPMTNEIMKPAGIQITDIVQNDSYPAYSSGIEEGELLIGMDGEEILEVEQFKTFLDTKSPGDDILIETNKTNYEITLAANPDDSEKPYLGVMVMQHSERNKEIEEKYGAATISVFLWIIGLLYWLYLLNLGIGLFNLVPLGPIDGGRMLQVVFRKMFKQGTADKLWKWTSLIFLFVIVFLVVFGFLK